MARSGTSTSPARRQGLSPFTTESIEGFGGEAHARLRNPLWSSVFSVVSQTWASDRDRREGDHAVVYRRRRARIAVAVLLIAAEDYHVARRQRPRRATGRQFDLSPLAGQV